MAQLLNAKAEAEAAARIATPLFWSASCGANLGLVFGRDFADALPALGGALVCEGAIYLALWTFMRGVRWAATPVPAKAPDVSALMIRPRRV
jgi:hypothetical protein